MLSAPTSVNNSLGRIITPYDAVNIGAATGEKPAYSCIPPRSVFNAERDFGYGSPQHLACLSRAEQATIAYLRGEGWADMDDTPSLQERIILRQEHEIGAGGAKGGGKSFGAILFQLKGNPHKPLYTVDLDNGDVKPIWVNISYIYHPNYLALVLRKNREDLDDWLHQAIPVFDALGGKFKGRQSGDGFEFYETGGTPARIRVGHLADPDSYTKYFGKAIIRLTIEELIQIAELSIYMNLRGCVRSAFSEMLAQLLATFNPQGGPGVQWVFDRFIEPKRQSGGKMVPILGADGEPIRAYDILESGKRVPRYPEPPIREVIDEDVYAKMGIPIPGLEDRTITRVFLPADLSNNPYLMRDMTYVNNLASDEDNRDAMLYGIWNLEGGSYFTTFRAQGPAGKHEPEWARHVYPSSPPSDLLKAHLYRPLKPWWARTMAMDWGYEHECSTLWGCRDQEIDVLTIYREMVYSQTQPEAVGAGIARATIPDLMGLPKSSINLWIGKDARQNRIGRDRTVEELLAAGIRTVLGPNSVHLPDQIIKKLDDLAYEKGEEVSKELVDQIRKQHRAGITILQAKDSRVEGWTLCRSLLRFVPIHPESFEDFDPKHAMELLFHADDGAEKYRQYIAHCSKRNVEILPKVRIWDSCPRLIESIPKARKKPKQPEDVDPAHFLGMDSLDNWRYLCMGERLEVENGEPQAAFLERRLEEIIVEGRKREAVGGLALSVNDLIRINDQLEREFTAKTAPAQFTLPHAARQRRMAIRQERLHNMNVPMPRVT